MAFSILVFVISPMMSAALGLVKQSTDGMDDRVESRGDADRIKFVIQLHWSHEGGREMMILLKDSFRWEYVDKGSLNNDDYLQICADPTRLLNGLSTRGMAFTQQERHAGQCFSPFWGTGCSKNIAFAITMRDPLSYQIRQRWDYESGRMKAFELPAECNHITSLLCLGGYATDSRCGQCQAPLEGAPHKITHEDFANAKSILKKMHVICITERYAECPLSVVAGTGVGMTQEDADAIASTLTGNEYLSAGVSNFVEVVMATGTPREKQWVADAKAILAYDIELYNVAQALARDQFNAGKLQLQKLQLQMKADGPSVNISQMARELDEANADHACGCCLSNRPQDSADTR